MKKPVWIDTDLSVGMRRYNRPGFSDVDDGYAILQLLGSEKVDLRGISTVFGNTRIDDVERLCREIVSYSSDCIEVYKGAGKKLDLSGIKTSDAVQALAEALKEQPMTIMAIGPATNIATLLLLYPELYIHICEIVLVAGRRHGKDYFEIGDTTQNRRAPDLNFDLDNDAFRVLLESGVPVTLCPFEISHKVWIKVEDLKKLESTGKPIQQWLAKHSRPWLQQWVEGGSEGFNPFDVLASHYIIRPEDIKSEQLNARMEIYSDDLHLSEEKTVFKQYLVCDNKWGYPIQYCYDVVENYHDKLIESLL